jgi:hypothetical protein
MITFDPLNKTIRLAKPEGAFTTKFTTFRLVLHAFDDVMTVKSNGKDYSVKLKSTKARFVEIPVSSETMVISYQ